MRRQKKQEIMDIVMLMEQAHVQIGKGLQMAQGSQVMELLADCQSAALSIGNQIEQTEGEDAAVISILEKYCEVLYRIYEQVGSGFYSSQDIAEDNGVQSAADSFEGICSAGYTTDAQSAVQSLEDLLEQVTQSIEDIPIRKEVVFLPYKASMWDSLESVWKAAAEDPACDVYVIPIPYFDRNADGSLGEMHYEGALYPKDVPVTDYRAYDIEKHKPDMIFIHNPYDDCNLVTSVHPSFYAERLKDYTEELVYIPYFILQEVSPENERAVESVAHFCTTPGVIHAHKVIVQSEQMKQVYVKVLTERFGEHTRFYWEQKILGLGSPKLDKAAHTGKEDVDIPQEWRKLMRKSDGTDKKVVLYNTGLTAFLQNDKRYLQKVRDVLHIFRECQDEVVLLWRPHPLLYTTAKAMRTELAEEYAAIVAEYKEEGWGIFDDTADMNRAVALADAYYGDQSSVVQLCQKAGMPVMIQNVNVLYGDQACLINIRTGEGLE